MAALLGTHEYRDRPGQVPWHSRSALLGWAAGVRISVGCGSPRSLIVRVPRLPLIAKPDRRGEFSAAATLFGNPASKTPSIAVPVENIFS
jgi:hypothetical protein